MTTKRCAVCGNPLPYHRSRYCSDECSQKMNSGNLGICALDDVDDAPGQFTPQELRAKNRELRAYGRRICRTHQGAALPLDDEHFYRANHGQFDTECKDCQKKRTVRYARERYQADVSFVEKRSEYAKRDQAKHRAKRLKAKREWKRREKAKRFAAVLQIDERAS